MTNLEEHLVEPNPTEEFKEIKPVMEEKPDLEELILYRKGVELLRKNDSPEINYNSGVEHAKIVLENLIDSAKSHVNILAGNFNRKVCSDKNGSYFNSLEKFLFRGGTINVVLNDHQPDVYNPTLDLLRLFSTSKKYQDKINVKTTKQKVYNTRTTGEIHFTVVDSKGFREEYDTDNFIAEFSFNHPVKAIVLNGVFDEVFKDAEPLPLSDLPTT